MNKRLMRSHNTMALGVAAGIAEYLDLDPTLIRLLFVLLFFGSGGMAFFLYLLLAIVMPKSSVEEDIIIEKEPDSF